MVDSVLTNKSSHQVFRPLELPQVTLGGEFGRRVEAMIEANILKIDVEKGFLADFRRNGAVAVNQDGHYTGLGKFIDSVVRLAAGTGDERLLALKKKLVRELIATQSSDGYIGVFADKSQHVQWLFDLHECAYIIWGLTSDHRLFGEAPSLAAARRLADYVIAAFEANPDLKTTKPVDYGFEINCVGFDRALLALHESTGDVRYRDFAVELMDIYGYGPHITANATSFTEHAYQYFSHCLGQLDLYRQSGDRRLLQTSHKALDFLRKGDGLLVTGTCSRWECFHNDQSGLDNSSETCAGVYLALFLDALLQIEGDSLYGDMMERDIYNALFAATSPDGSQSRYFTPFDGERAYDYNGGVRYCCANNNRRFLANLRNWLYYRTGQGVAVNLYSASTAQLNITPDIVLRLKQETDYPKSGAVRITVDPSKEAQFEVKLRIPRWCKEATISINDAETMKVSGGQFYGITRKWRPGDVIELNMPMDWRFVRGRRSQDGRAAVLRGPVVFTFNPERNRELVQGTEPNLKLLRLGGSFDPRLLKINPAEVASPLSDASIRPDGISCQIQAWPPRSQPWPFVNRVPLALTEYPDPGGTAIYFIVSGEGKAALTEDELI